MKYWQIKQKEDHWLDLVDPEGWYDAGVKWDGCVHFNRYFNLPLHLRVTKEDQDELSDYIHICSIDDMINRLTELKQIAQDHFGGDWDECKTCDI